MTTPVSVRKFLTIDLQCHIFLLESFY